MSATDFDKRAFLIQCVTNAGSAMVVSRNWHDKAGETLDEEIKRLSKQIANLKQTRKTLQVM